MWLDLRLSPVSSGRAHFLSLSDLMTPLGITSSSCRDVRPKGADLTLFLKLDLPFNGYDGPLSCEASDT